jgi:signal transduction histidine kinase
MDEAHERLAVAQETELLRIAQEAVTNVRRHANAENVWVTCRVDPPYAFLRVADDGAGMDSPRNDSFGLDIMQERADRIGAELTWHPRDGGGTVLEVVLQPPAGEREE